VVNDVERQFNGLKHHPEALGFYRRNGANDPTQGRHYHGIARLPGEGTPRFLTSKCPIPWMAGASASPTRPAPWGAPFGDGNRVLLLTTGKGPQPGLRLDLLGG
jgi:hypothetical protein